jgi:hypothetical protein
VTAITWVKTIEGALRGRFSFGPELSIIIILLPFLLITQHLIGLPKYMKMIQWKFS